MRFKQMQRFIQAKKYFGVMGTLRWDYLSMDLHFSYKVTFQVDYSKMLDICSTISSPGSILWFNSPLFVNTGSGTVSSVWLSILDCLSQSIEEH